MPTITISSFLGENRAAEPKLIPDGQGAVSMNQKPGRGDLRPWRQPAQVFTAPGGTQTIYRMGQSAPSDTQYWLAWPSVVHAAQGFDAEDTTERTVFTGAGAPKVTDNLALSATQPTVNPTVTRPLGIPAPATAPSVKVNLPVPGPDEGKYWMGIYAKDLAGLVAGEEFRITVDGGTPQPFTLVNGTGGKVTQASFAAQIDALQGVRAFAAGEDDEDVPLGVKVISDQVGKTFTFERMLGTKQDFDPATTSLTQLFSSVGGSGSGTVVLRSTATTSQSFSVLLADATLSTLESGDSLSCTVSGAQRFSVTLTGNSRSSVLASLVAGGVQATLQEYVPGNYSGSPGESYDGQPGGVRITVGATNTGSVVELVRNAPTSATIIINQAWLTANAKPGDRWQVQVNSASPVSVTLTAGVGTYPAVVTPASLKQALGTIANLRVTEELVSGAPQLRIESVASGAGTAVTIKKIVPSTAKTWGNLVTALLIAPKKREVADYFYVYTYVNDWGWESAPSPVSSAAERTVEETVTLSNFAQPPTGGYSVNRIRLYRTQAGASGNSDFFFLREAAISVPTLDDDGRDIGEVLPTKRWLPAPGVPRGGADNYTEQNLSTLTPMWNGMLAGICAGAVRFCEAYTPYAWPIAYDAVPPNGRAVGLGVFGQNLLVLTTGKPLLVSGSSPEALDQAPLEVPQSCISPRSVVSMGSGVAWASNDGLCWFGSGGARMLTDGVLLREDWLKLRPQTIIGQMYEGVYLGSYEPVEGQPRKGFIIDPAGGAGIFFLDEGFDAAHFDSSQDQLYILRGTKIMKWDTAEQLMQARFRSRVYRTPRPVSFAVSEVIASVYPVEISVWADGELIFEDTITDREVFTLPSHDMASDWQVELRTQGAVQGVILATSVEEITAV